METIFISGISSGIGKSLALLYAKKNVQVFGISRRKLEYSHKNIKHMCLDIAKENDISKLRNFLPERLDLAILNAAVLGTINSMKDANLAELKDVMQINMWGQKLIIDELLKKETSHIYAISSGAAIKGSLGWSGYSLSKAALNMLIQLYASENKKTHFIAFAPGLVDTAMQEHICEKVDLNKFENMKRLKAARGTEKMPSPEEFAIKFDQVLSKSSSLESGSYFDIRNT